jgi:hypothetical protein
MNMDHRTRFAFLAAALLAAAPTPAQDVKGDKLQIVEGHAGVDPETGFVKIRGEVWNRSGQWVKAPRVIVELFDPKGRPIGVTGFLTEVKRELDADERDSVVTERYFLPPGEAAAFEYVRDPNKLGGAAYGSHKLSAAAWNLPGGGPMMAVEGFQSTRDADGAWTVGGVLRNKGKAGCRSPKAVLAFYDDAGKVAGVTSVEPDETFQKTLAAGQTVRFTRPAIAETKAKEVKVWADCSDPD